MNDWAWNGRTHVLVWAVLSGNLLGRSDSFVHDIHRRNALRHPSLKSSVHRRACLSHDVLAIEKFLDVFFLYRNAVASCVLDSCEWSAIHTTRALEVDAVGDTDLQVDEESHREFIEIECNECDVGVAQ